MIAGTLMLLVAAGATLSGCAAGHGESSAQPSASSSDEDVVSEFSQEMDAYADTITEAYEDTPGFGSVRLWQDRDTVTIYWVGDVPEYISDLAGEHEPGFEVEIVEAAYSERELLELARSLLSHGDSLVEGASLISVGVNPDGSGLNATYEGDAALADELAAAAEEFIGVPVVAEVGDAIVPLLGHASR